MDRTRQKIRPAEPMPDKLSEFEVLEKILEFLDVAAAVECFAMVFEIGLWQALWEVFPSAALKGCLFHWAQAINRHMQELGLSTTYRERGTVHTLISKLLALPFLPGDQIKRAFTRLRERADTSSKPVADLFTYVNDQWMENSCWSPDEWSVYKQTVRTNNDTEGYHRGLNNKAGRGKLAFYVLIPILHQEAKMVDYTVNLVSQEIICRIRRAVYQSLDKRISELWDDYDHHEFRTEEFLEKVGEIYGQL